MMVCLACPTPVILGCSGVRRVPVRVVAVHAPDTLRVPFFFLPVVVMLSMMVMRPVCLSDLSDLSVFLFSSGSSKCMVHTV